MLYHFSYFIQFRFPFRFPFRVLAIPSTNIMICAEWEKKQVVVWLTKFEKKRIQAWHRTYVNYVIHVIIWQNKDYVSVILQIKENREKTTKYPQTYFHDRNQEREIVFNFSLIGHFWFIKKNKSMNSDVNGYSLLCLCSLSTFVFRTRFIWRRYIVFNSI